MSGQFVCGGDMPIKDKKYLFGYEYKLIP